MTDINSTPQPAAIGTRMCKAALGLGLRVHPCDHVVPAGDGTFESSKAKWQRKLARRDGTEVKPVLSPGKLPHLKGWQKAATNDPERVRAYWASREEGGFPKANIGVATGPDSDLFVLDIDGEEGKCSLDNLIGRYGALPTTVTVITQSGGTHYWFRWPESLDLRNTASALGSGIDTRGDGGLLIPRDAAPSFRFEVAPSFRD